MEKEDFPRSIVVILVILAVAISVLGTFTLITEINRLNRAPVYDGRNTQMGKVSLTVQDPNDGIISTTGQITLNVEAQ